MREGVCSECHSIHPTFGSHRDGSGTIPQAVVTEEKLVWADLTDDQIKERVRAIVRDSQSDEEIERRVAGELGDSCGMAITSYRPTDDVGRQAQGIVKGLGGLTRKDGVMVMIMIYGPRGNIISI